MESLAMATMDPALRGAARRYNLSCNALSGRWRDNGEPRVKGLLLVVMAGALWVAHAAEARDMRPGFGAPAQVEEKFRKKRPAQDARDQRERWRPRDGQHRRRLTDEERRDLHRDLDRANREIYRR